MSTRTFRRPAVGAVLLALLPAGAFAQSSFEELLRATSADARPGREVSLTPVREAALRETAMQLGVQWGLGDRSREIAKEIEAVAAKLDRRYGFGQLMMGVGFLPPVISEARDAVAIEGSVMRIAKRAYKIDEPPRPVAVAPTWRDWLYVGLDAGLRPARPSHSTLLPRDAQEQEYFQREMRRAYEEGRKQAADVFDLNLARLNRTYDGMRRFYDLYKRGMVTAPVIASASTIIDTDDINTVVIGNTVFRITVGPQFIADPSIWTPLAD